MATESVADRVNKAAASVDGVASVVNDWVQSDDLNLSRQAYAMGDLLERISADLSRMASELEKAA